MIKKWILTGCLLLSASILVTSCSSSLPEQPGQENDTPLPDETPSTKVVERVYMESDDIESGDNPHSRTNLTLGDNKLVFTWAEQDQVGVVPMEGSQIFFTVKAGAGTKHAKFDGGAWSLKADATYAAYFPYAKENTDASNSAIKFSYEGQKQQGDASLAHMGAYDLMAAPATSAVDDEVLFKFKHMNSVGIFRLILPADDVYTSFAVRSVKPLLHKTANLDFSGAEVSYAATDPTNQLKMELSDVATKGPKKDILLYMMLPPMDFTLTDVQVVVHSASNKTYQGSLARKNMKAGHAYNFTVTMTDVTVSSEISSPSFGNSDVEL